MEEKLPLPLVVPAKSSPPELPSAHPPPGVPQTLAEHRCHVGAPRLTPLSLPKAPRVPTLTLFFVSSPLFPSAVTNYHPSWWHLQGAKAGGNREKRTLSQDHDSKAVFAARLAFELDGTPAASEGGNSSGWSFVQLEKVTELGGPVPR